MCVRAGLKKTTPSGFFMAVVHNQSHQVTTADPAARGAAVAEIEAVYRSRLDAFVRVCTALLGSREQAIDAVHDGFAAALTRRASFRGDGSIEGWLWAVVLNAARNYRRALAVRAAGADREGGEQVTPNRRRPTGSSATTSPSFPSASGSCSSCATTPTSTIGRSPRRSASQSAPSGRR